MNTTRMVLTSLLGATLFSSAVLAQETWYVECGDCAECPDPPDCMENTFCSIQHAIDCASDGDEIIVAPGTCCETINFPIPPDEEPVIEITVRSSDGPAVTIIDGSGLDDSVVKCISGQGPDTVLEGFTITGGTGHVFDTVSSLGGGMFILNSSPTVMNCVFNGNVAVDGGGMYNRNGSNPTVINCTFSNNMATDGTAASVGGGMANMIDSSPTVSNCTFSGNFGREGGGGMYNHQSNPAVTNCTFNDNVALNGAGMDNLLSSPLVSNCTFSGNSASNSGGGIMVASQDGSDTTVTNSIFWENTDNGGANMDEFAQIHVLSGSVTVTYSDLQGGWTGSGGTGNINADPMFVDAANGDLHLSSGSPCIDAGHHSGVPDGITTDLDGNPRIVDGDCDGDAIVDMGAYEFQRTCTPCCPADLNCDGVVGPADLAMLLASWGVCEE